MKIDETHNHLTPPHARGSRYFADFSLAGRVLSSRVMTTDSRHVVAVIGAGPAGLFAARALAGHGCRVALLNRDIKPGGLAEYGIFLNKYKMKSGLRRQFQKILSDPRVTYLGHVAVGE